MSAFDEVGSIPPLPIWEGLRARTVNGERITLAVVELDADAPLPEHSHENEQLGVVIRGRLTLRVGAEERELTAGMTWRIDSHTPHSGHAGPEGAVVVDVFSPPRDDWKQLRPAEDQPPRWP
jgi:unsaturated pyranuronate lyase